LPACERECVCLHVKKTLCVCGVQATVYMHAWVIKCVVGRTSASSIFLGTMPQCVSLVDMEPRVYDLEASNVTGRDRNRWRSSTYGICSAQSHAHMHTPQTQWEGKTGMSQQAVHTLTSVGMRKLNAVPMWPCRATRPTLRARAHTHTHTHTQ